MTAPAMIRSGWCGAGWHGRCVGSYSGCACDCDCHSAVEPERPLRIGSLFSGYEGLGMAVEEVLGSELAWVSDIDPGACKILAHHWPEVPNIGDITTVDWDTVEDVEILTGGFPCQDVSAAGKRLGMKPGTRSGLWSQMAYAIAQLHPSLVVIENVRGLLSARADGALEPCPWCVGDNEGHALRALGGVLGDLAGLGYNASWHGLRAADVGAPHGRFRVFVAAWPAQDTDIAAGGQRWIAAPGQAQGGRARANAGGRGGALAAHTSSVAAGTGRDGATAKRRQGHSEPGGCAPAYASSQRGERRGEHDVVAGPAGAGQGDWGERQRNGDAANDRGAAARWGPYEPAVRRWEQLTRTAPAPTEPGKTGQPRLSPAFVEWLMGLPAGHVTQVPGLTRNEQLKALGNGVVPQQAAAALRMLLPDVAASPLQVAA